MMFLMHIQSFSGVMTDSISKYELSVRANGMGNTFTGISDDLSSLIYNPAGLSLIEHRAANFYHSDKFGTGINEDYLSFATPFGRKMFGISYVREAIDDIPIIDASQQISGFLTTKKSMFTGTLSWLQGNMRTGMTFKMLSTNLGQGFNGDGYAFDIGFLKPLNRKYSLGLLLQDVISDFSWDSGRNDDISMTTRLGVGYKSRLEDFKAGFDYIMEQNADSYFSFGAEYYVSSIFCVRAGFNDGDISYGFGIKYDEWVFDYASQQGEFEDTVTISATMNLKKVKTSIDREMRRYRDGKVIRKAEIAPQDRSSSNSNTIPGSDAIKAVLDRYSAKNEEIKVADKKLEFHRKELEIPEEAKMHYKLGNTFLLEEVFTKAIEEYKIAIEIYPSYGQAHYNLAALYEKMEFTEKAIYEYQMVTQIDPYNVNAYIALGNLYLSMNNVNDAIKFFNKVIIIAPGSKSAELAEQKIRKLNEK